MSVVFLGVIFSLIGFFKLADKIHKVLEQFIQTHVYFTYQWSYELFNATFELIAGMFSDEYDFGTHKVIVVREQDDENQLIQSGSFSTLISEGNFTGRWSVFNLVAQSKLSSPERVAIYLFNTLALLIKLSTIVLLIGIPCLFFTEVVLGVGFIGLCVFGVLSVVAPIVCAAVSLLCSMVLYLIVLFFKLLDYPPGRVLGSLGLIMAIAPFFLII